MLRICNLFKFWAFGYLIMLPTFGSAFNSSDTLEFLPLTLVDVLPNVDDLRQRKADEPSSSDYFFVREYENQNGLFLVREVEKAWQILDFEIHHFGSNTSIKEIRVEHGPFISVQLTRSPSGACATSYGIIVLLNLDHNEWTQFWNYNFVECYNDRAEVASTSACKTNFFLVDSVLELTRSNSVDSGLYCAESARYRFENRRFVKAE